MLITDPLPTFIAGIELWYKLERGRITEEEYQREMRSLLADLQRANEEWENGGAGK